MRPRAHRILLTAASAALAALLLPPLAAAQPSSPPPPPPGGGGYGGGYYAGPPPVRQGLTVGFGFGVGAMDSDSNLAQCFDCDYEPGAVSFDFHLGGMINPQMAALFELWVQGQQIDEAGFNWLNQVLVMGALQYWLTPQFWLKGGLGIANLSVHYDDGYYYGDDDVAQGLALMGAAGYEVLHSTRFAIDLQLRLGSGSYDGIDEQVNTAMIAVGFNWY
ncbi:MAG TPA: hypothetical protein VKZ63_01830 [Kofleriaceae bacterium]|nr:hypothetical protein [Kofleriaceae bacterium]